MKTKTKQIKRVTRKKAKKPVMTTAIMVRNKTGILSDLCGNCGKADPKGGAWQDPEGSKRYVWCRSAKCKAKVQATAPWRVSDHYVMHPRKRILIGDSLYEFANSIELSNDIENGADVVKGYSARICHDAWAYSIFVTDKLKALKLFKVKPSSVFLVFNEDGKMTGHFRTYRDADKKRTKKEVIVFWGGR